jgi:hypothetical protein
MVLPRARPVEAATDMARLAQSKWSEVVMQSTHRLGEAAHESEHGLRRLATKIALVVEVARGRVQEILFDENAKAVARMARRRAEEDRRRGRR